MPNAKIVWLASYPKSGNTWLRILLSNLQADTNKPININDISDHGIASAKPIFEQQLGIDVSDLSNDEIDRLKPEIYCNHIKKQPRDLYLKVHDAYQINSNKQPLFPKTCSLGVVHVVRNPLDVAISLANHLDLSFAQSVTVLNNSNYQFCGKSDRDHHQLTQYLGNWSHHTQSWQQADMPVHLVRYEDLKADTLGTFSKIIAFMGLEYTDTQIEKAVRFSDIKELQKQEKSHDFKERPSKAKRFFRKGDTGDGALLLDHDQQQSIIEAHQATMRTLGYLPEIKP